MFLRIKTKFNSLTNFQTLFTTSFTILLSIFTLFTLFQINSSESNSAVVKLLLSIYIIAVYTLFTYLSVYDIVYFEIPGKLAVILPIAILVVNILLGLVIGFNSEISYWAGNSSTPLINIIGGIAGALVIGVIVFLTKGKGMGEGDIWVLAGLGFFIGYEKLIIAFYISIFSALIIGLLYSYRIKKLKGVPIPFVPFLVFGCLVAFSLNIDYRILFNF
jgi:leader peptidase (prepilin peptidase)/N-methyltransferase